MLCNSAEGTPAEAEAMNTAVPGTRIALECADLVNTSSGIPLVVIVLRISARPRDHVVSRMNTTVPISSGTQPPSGTLVRLAAR